MKKTIIIFSLLITSLVNSQIINFNHNIGHNIIDQLYNFSCTGGGVDWARVFVLDNFDVTGELTLTAGKFAIESANTAPGDGVIVSVYAIDDGFPETFNESNILGTTGLIDIPPTGNTIFPFNFDPPIIVPTNIEMLLVEVKLTPQTQLVFIGGTADTWDYSWFRSPSGCIGDPDLYRTTYDIDRPNLNYYITVSGEQTLGVQEISEENISISPNPVRNKLSIQMPSEFEANGIVIYDINGKVLLETNIAEELDVSHFNSGLYFIKISSSQGVISKKFLKL